MTNCFGDRASNKGCQLHSSALSYFSNGEQCPRSTLEAYAWVNVHFTPLLICVDHLNNGWRKHGLKKDFVTAGCSEEQQRQLGVWRRLCQRAQGGKDRRAVCGHIRQWWVINTNSIAATFSVQCTEREGLYCPNKTQFSSDLNVLIFLTYTMSPGLCNISICASEGCSALCR